METELDNLDQTCEEIDFYLETLEKTRNELSDCEESRKEIDDNYNRLLDMKVVMESIKEHDGVSRSMVSSLESMLPDNLPLASFTRTPTHTNLKEFTVALENRNWTLISVIVIGILGIIARIVMWLIDRVSSNTPIDKVDNTEKAVAENTVKLVAEKPEVFRQKLNDLFNNAINTKYNYWLAYVLGYGGETISNAVLRFQKQLYPSTNLFNASTLLPPGWPEGHVGKRVELEGYFNLVSFVHNTFINEWNMFANRFNVQGEEGIKPFNIEQYYQDISDKTIVSLTHFIAIKRKNSSGVRVVDSGDFTKILKAHKELIERLTKRANELRAKETKKVITEEESFDLRAILKLTRYIEDEQKVMVGFQTMSEKAVTTRLKFFKVTQLYRNALKTGKLPSERDIHALIDEPVYPNTVENRDSTPELV